MAYSDPGRCEVLSTGCGQSWIIITHHYSQRWPFFAAQQGGLGRGLSSFVSSPVFLPGLSYKQGFPHSKHTWSTLRAHSGLSSPLHPFATVLVQVPIAWTALSLASFHPCRRQETCRILHGLPHTLRLHSKVQVQSPAPSALHITFQSKSPFRSAPHQPNGYHQLRGAFSCLRAFEWGLHAGLSPFLKCCLLSVIFPSCPAANPLPILADLGVPPCPLCSTELWLRIFLFVSTFNS